MEERIDTTRLRKARGAFFTPPAVSEAIARWAIREPASRVLEPSCGEAAFLLSAATVLADLGSVGDAVDPQLVGVELHAQSARKAGERLREARVDHRVLVSDFFDLDPDPTYDVVLGNPPYVRYQEFSGAARRKAQERALAQGVRLSGMASSWAAFTVHAASFLTPLGRLGLVIPGELLSRDYASSIRSFLLSRFSRVALVVFEARVFPGVLEEVVLLLAEGSGGTDHFELYEVRDTADLESRDFAAPPGRRWAPRSGTTRLTRALGDERGTLVLDALRRDGLLTELSTYGDPRLGIVTGANKYFALSASGVRRHKLADHELLRLSPPGSKHVRRVAFTEALWEEQRNADARCFLFRPTAPVAELSAGAARFVRAGEDAGISDAYKCRVRTPWWRVPDAEPPDLFVTYMNHDTVQICANDVGVRCLNSLHGVRVRLELDAPMARRLLPVAAISSATLASAELVGRAFGGGMLQVLPREAARLLVPSPSALARGAERLERMREDVDSLLEGGFIDGAAKLADTVILDTLGNRDLAAVRKTRSELRARRFARSGA